MKKRFLVVLIVMAVYAAMAGCGKDVVQTNNGYRSDSSTPQTDSSDNHTGTTEETPIKATESDMAGVFAEEDTTSHDDSDSFIDSSEGKNVSLDESETEEVESEESVVEVSLANKVVLLKVDWTSQVLDVNYELSVVDPYTGQQTPLRNFYFVTIPDNETEYMYTPAHTMSRYANYRDLFSGDYTKIAVTETELADQESHAGWMNEEGEFTDVTELLGLQSQSDFDDPVKYQAVGFMDDTTFVYIDMDENKYFTVDIDNIEPSSVQEIDASQSPYLHVPHSDYSWMRDCSPSCWVDETHFYGDIKREHSVFVDLTTKERKDYIPGDSRLNWGAVYHPAKDAVVFVSKPDTNNGVADLYRMSLSDQNVSLVCNLDNTAQNDIGDVDSFIQANNLYYAALECEQ